MRSQFTSEEIAYLTDQPRLGRLATADEAGRPQVTPVGMWSLVPETGYVEVRGRDLDRTRKFRNVSRNPQAALVVDDIASGPGWNPRAVMIEGPAEALLADGNGGGPVIRIRPDRIRSWGLGSG